MKNSILTLAVVAIFGTVIFNTATAQVSKDEVQVVQELWGQEKRAIISENMKFTEAEVTKFGPLYDLYMIEHQKLGEERIKVISEYVNNYAILSDTEADELAQRLFKNNLAIDQLQLKYFNKMKTVITPKRAAQFFQLELYIQTMIRSELQSNIPFIGELDKRVK